MKISAENNLNSDAKVAQSSAKLDPAISALIRNQSHGLAIEKFSLLPNLNLTLNLVASGNINQIQLSGLTPSLIDYLIQNISQLKLNVLNQTAGVINQGIGVKLLSNSKDSLNFPLLKFAQANLLKNNALELSLLLNQPQIERWLQKNLLIPTESANVSPKITNNKQQNFLNIVNQYLTKYIDKPSALSTSIPELHSALNQLINSILTVSANPVAKKQSDIPNQSPQINSQTKSIQLDQAQTKALLNLIPLKSGNDQQVSPSLLLNFNHTLTSILKPQDKSLSLSIPHRIKTSGNQFEQQSISSVINTLNKQTNTPNKPTNAQLPNEALQNLSTTQDLKSVGFGLKQLAENLIRIISSSNNSPINIPQALKPLIEVIISHINNQPALKSLTLNQLFSNNTQIEIAQTHQSNLPNKLGGLILNNTTTSQTNPLNFLVQLLSGSSQIPSANHENIEASLKFLGESISRLFPNQLPAQQNLNAFISPLYSNKLYRQQLELLNKIIAQSEQLLSRIEHSQLQSVRSDFSGALQYLVELPVMHLGTIDAFELLFSPESDTTDNKKNKKSWKVTIKFDLPPLKPIFARVSLNNDEITTDFYSNDQQTVDLIESNIDKLNQSLFKAGVKVKSLTGQKGIVPNELVETLNQGVDIKV